MTGHGRFLKTGFRLALGTFLSGLTVVYAPAGEAYDFKDLLKSIAAFRKPASAPTPTPPSNMCTIPFVRDVQPIKIKDRNIYFEITEFDFLFKSDDVTFDDVELELTVKGKHQESKNFSLSLNGTKISRRDGNKSIDLVDYIKAKGNSRLGFKLHKFFLNGSEPFHRFLMRLKKNKGQLKITIGGKNKQVVDAVLKFKGHTGCVSPTPTPTPGSSPTPTPAPTPTPVPTPEPENLADYAVRIDSAMPSTDVTNVDTMLLYFSANKSDGTFWCSIDLGSYEKCQSPVSLAALSNGDHSIEVYAKTPRGTASEITARYQWTVDKIAPVVVITNAGELPTLTNVASSTFTFTSTKPGKFLCGLDGANLIPCVSPLTFNDVSEDLHTFLVRSVDKVGNTSGVAEFRWTVDLTPPEVQILSVNPARETGKENYKNIVFNSTEAANFECAVDGAPFALCESPVNLTNLDEGNHRLEIKSTDLAGNVGTVASYTWQTDYTSPVLSVAGVIPAQGITNSSQVSIDFTVSEPARSYCSLNGAPMGECSSPYAGVLVDGLNQLTMYAQDIAGNSSVEQTLQWSVDLTAPIISFGEILPVSSPYIASRYLTASINRSEFVAISATLNGQPITAVNDSIELGNLTDGSYELLVTGVDAAGNAANTISHRFTVDMTAPTLTINSDGSNLSNKDFRTIVFSSNESASFECALDENGFEPCQSPIAYSGLGDGNHQFTLRGTDLAGNQKNSGYAWSIDTQAPATFETHTQNIDAITFTLSSDEPNVRFICSLDGALWSDCDAVAAFAGLSEGNHTFTARAVDAVGNTDPVGVTYMFDVVRPITTFITGPSTTLTNSKSISITFTSDLPASGFQCSLDGQAFVACSSPVNYDGLADGNHSVVVRAIGASGTPSPLFATKQWTVDTTPPSVTGFTLTATSNSITVNWSTNEPAAIRIIYGVGAALNQSSIDSGTFLTSGSVKLVGLSPNTTYSVQILTRDQATNSSASTIKTIRTSR